MVPAIRYVTLHKVLVLQGPLTGVFPRLTGGTLCLFQEFPRALIVQNRILR